MVSPDASDADLLAAWRDVRDEDALRLLCARHAGLVAATARRLGSPDPDEATQAAILLMARRAAPGDGPRLAGWLVECVRRVCSHQRRTAARRRRHEAEAAMAHARQRTAGDDAVWSEAQPHLADALASLSPARREAVLRFHLQGKPQAQVAAELGCSTDAVKTRVHEGLERLRTFLARRGVAIGAAALATGLTAEAHAAEPALAARCADAVLTPTAMHASTALAAGVATAMRIKATAIAAATTVLVASCLTATWSLAGEAPQPAPATVPPAAAPAAAPLDPAANAALAWWRAFDAMPKEDDPSWDLVNRNLTAPAPFSDPELDSILTRTQPLDLFALGAARPYCTWGVDVRSEGAAALLPYNSKVRYLFRLNALRARWHASRGDGEAAVTDLQTGLRAAHLHPGLEPMLIDWLVGSSCASITTTAAGTILPRLQPAQRRRLETILAALPARTAAADCMDQELRMASCEIDRLLGMPYSQRIVAVNNLVGTSASGGVAGMAAAVTDTSLQSLRAGYPVEVARWRAHLQLPLAQRLVPISPQFSTGDAPPHPLLGMFAPAVSLVAATEVRIAVERAMLLAALAYLDEGEAGLARHPDPATGRAFAIAKTAAGFSLQAELAGQKKPCALRIGEPADRTQAQPEPQAPAIPDPF